MVVECVERVVEWVLLFSAYFLYIDREKKKLPMTSFSGWTVSK